VNTLVRAILVVVALAPALSAQTASFTGKWEGSFTVQNANGTAGDTDPILFNLTQKGTELTGTFGDADHQWPVEKGVVNAGTATFEVQQPNGPLMQFTLTVTADKLNGEMQFVRGGVVRARAKVEASKPKEALNGSGGPAQVVRVGDLNTRQIRALDRDRTVVLLQGGMLEEHGPYLPAFTDGILSDRLTLEVANGVVAKKPEWTALLFPPVSVGASGYNEIGRQFTFPGTYAVRPSTLKAMYMDLATQLGEQGFKWIMVVHVHGSPLHIAALDDAGDYFRDTYGGRMVNLWGLLPVIGGWGTGMSAMTEAQKKEDGVSLHGGADEHSLMLHLQPNLVAPDYQQAPPFTGSTYAESVAAARQKDWPGYIGAPRLGNAALGRRIWTSLSGTALKTTLEILEGADPAKYPRYLPLMATNPAYQEWIASATDRDRALGKQQDDWSAQRRDDAKGNIAAQFVALEATWNKAYLGNDAAALDRLWADDIVVFVPRSRPMSKADALATLKDGTTRFTRFETAAVHPRVTGDLAVVTGRVQRTRTVSPSTSPRAGGSVASEDWQFRKVYRRDASGWRVISYHAWELPQ